MASTEEMLTFVSVVELGSFAAAAEKLEMSPSAVSKLVTRIEDRLSARLFTRTTRRLALTSEGTHYLRRANEILALVGKMEEEIRSSAISLRGRIRVDASTAIATRISARDIPDFLKLYPDVVIDLTANDRVIDPVAEQVDVVFGTGERSDPELIVRKMTDLRRVVCASPDYLARHGVPEHPSDLLRHNCLALSTLSRLSGWPFLTGEGVNRLRIGGNFSCDSVTILLAMALRGEGIVRLANFVVGEALASGALVEILAEQHAPEPLPLIAIMPPGRNLVPRVRTFVDFMAARFRANALDQSIFD